MLNTLIRSVDTELYLSLASCLFPTQFFGHSLLDRLRFLLRGRWDRGLQFSLCSSLLCQQLWVDVGQDSTCCNSHTFQQLGQEHRVKNWSSCGPTWLEKRKSVHGLHNAMCWNKWHMSSLYKCDMSTMFFSRYVQQLTWFNSSSLAMASRMCRGVTRPFLLSLAALPANSKISATWVKEKVKI